MASAPGTGRRLLYLLQYAVVLTAAAFLALSVVSLPLGWGFVGVKIGLFVVGVMTLGYGTYLAWPSSPEEVYTEDSGSEGESWFQKRVGQLPPAAWYPVHPDERYPDWINVYLATLCIFVTSYVMESVFGVVA